MTIYTKELALEICKRLANGESLRTICKDDGMPDESTVRSWAVTDMEGFSTQYMRARDLQAEALAEEIIDIGDNETIPSDSRRIRVDVRKWYASKVIPKKYGDKTTTEVTGADGGAIQHTHAVRYIKPDGTDS